MGDVVQLHPHVPNAIGGNLATVVAVHGDTYTLEALQAGRLATYERVPGSALERIGRAAFIRTEAGWGWRRAVEA